MPLLPTSPASSPPYYPALTGLRALAAFAVFGFHHRNTHAFGPAGLDAGFRAVLGELHLGVSVFFTLSGFLITKRYARQGFGTAAAWGRYLAHRAARIGPVYVLLLTLTWVVHRGGVGLYLANLTLVKGLVERWLLTGIPQAWSLTVEEGFYLLAPLVFGLGWRYQPGRSWPLLALGLAALGLALYAAVPALGTPLFALKATIFGRLPEFLAGAAFAWAPPRQGRGRATAGGAVALLAALALLVAIGHATHGVSLDSYPGVLANDWLLPVATGWLLHGLSTEATRLSWLLGTAPLQLLGRASYCFYLLHLGVVPDWLTPALRHWLPAGPAVGALFGLLVLAAVGLYYLVEKPAHRWLLGLLKPRVAHG